MNEISQGFINSIGGNPKETFIIKTNCQKYNGETFATLTIAEDFSKELKSSGYNANVIDSKTGEILFMA